MKAQGRRQKAEGTRQRLIIVNRIDGRRVPPMAWNDLVHALKLGEENAAVRGLLELLTLRLGIARTHEDVDEMPDARRHFHSGEARALNEVAEWIMLMGSGNAEALPEAVKEHFGWKPKTKTKSQSAAEGEDD